MSVPDYFLDRQRLEDVSQQAAMAVPYGQRLLTRWWGGWAKGWVSSEETDIGPHLALDGYWESWVTVALARYLHTHASDLWAVDVGAHYGYYTVFLAKASRNGRILAWEPDPYWAALLQQNLVLNGLTSVVECRDEVVGDSRGETEFRTAWGHRCTRRCTTLDAAVPWDRLDLIKIDAEGAELFIWHGMQDLLRRFPKLTVLIELHPQFEPARTVALLQQIQAQYRLRHVTDSGDLAEVSGEQILAHPHRHWMLWLP